jgi:hypothetical protein
MGRKENSAHQSADGASGSREKRLRRFQGGTSASVTLMKADDGRLFVRKTATSQEELLVLRGQVAQMDAVKSVGAPPGLYPTVLAQYDNGFDMEYIPAPNLAASSTRTRYDVNIIERHFEMVSQLPKIHFNSQGGGTGYVARHASQRCSRWRSIPSPSSRHAAFASLAARWMETAQEVDSLIGPHLLHTAVHGDLRLENIITCAAPDMRGPVYVDLRGKDLVWSGGVPYWDLAMDICSFLLSRYLLGITKGQDRSSYRADPYSLISLIRNIRSDSGADPTFFQRVLFYFAIKCIGRAWIVERRRHAGYKDDVDSLRNHVEALEHMRPGLGMMDEASATVLLCMQLRRD